MGYRKRCNQAELARVLGCSSPALTKAKHDPTFPPFDKDNQVEIYAGCIWWHQRTEGPAVNPAAGDEMLVGAESEGLERYRMAKAQLEEIKLAEQRHQIVRLDDFQEAVQAIMGPYRRMAEHLKRIGQNELWEMLEEANREVLTGLERFDGHGDTTGADTLDSLREIEPAGVG